MTHKKRTIHQEWASERCYMSKGTITRILMNISSIASKPSTTVDEADKLLEARFLVQEVYNSWDHPWNRTLSFEGFTRRKNL